MSSVKLMKVHLSLRPSVPPSICPSSTCLSIQYVPTAALLLDLRTVSTWFERITIMVILLNCVTLGMYQPCENIDCASDHCQILQAFDAFIYIFFALEMVVKMVALGIFGRRCYLGDTWNRLDFFIVMAGMVEYSLDLQNINLSAIRTVRVLRPLKAINRVPNHDSADVAPGLQRGPDKSQNSDSLRVP
ncbi:Voltage-dependent T-type calcium channel subunit alpha-1I [Takifugu flavidus]|uniref:Voltage-dependent T-type calcium channel subunit alpha-1I n=1 Tax=Takifugu flavidus TaxID=433684 RepID=A0A5C6NRW1_9TELE|nr:Voltage-dependent T-type calcium channel subunit alpha-1I [Takifugu flavidus]